MALSRFARSVSRRVGAPQSLALAAHRQAPSALALRAFSSVANPEREFLNQSFLSGNSGVFVDEMYDRWLQAPGSVHSSWDVYFRTGQYQAPPILVPDYGKYVAPAKPAAAGAASAPAATPAPARASVVVEESSTTHLTSTQRASLLAMARGFQVRGHLLADLDPLKLSSDLQMIAQSDLRPEAFGFTEEDMDKIVEMPVVDSQSHFFKAEPNSAPLTLRHIYNRLRETYCGTVGYEYMHIPFADECQWIRERIETRRKKQLTKEEKLLVLRRLTWADHFERFIASKHNTAKRFGLEGAEGTIPGLMAMLSQGAELGVDTVVLGMPHRGRLNVLANVMKKPLEHILYEFDPQHGVFDFQGSGDVKYHMGASCDTQLGPNNHNVHFSLVANPSHLEAVDPVVCGKARAKQRYQNDEERKKVMTVLLHGDAAFAGQGVVAETLAMSQCPHYTVGGTVHLVVNNQVGFTTDPSVGRSSPYCSDIGKSVNAPIFHVNGDDIEAVTHVCEMAAEFRMRFGKDVVVDLVSYRLHGHNEIDEPLFTQPRMYKKIHKQDSVLSLYQKQLIMEGVLSREDCNVVSEEVTAELQSKYEKVKDFKPQPEAFHANWKSMKPNEPEAPRPTGLELATLKEIGTAGATYPEDLQIHRRLKGIFQKRVQTLEAGEGLDWATAESIAFGSLIKEGFHVRLSGQDVERGTFSQRHAVVHDQEDFSKYVPLAKLVPGQPDMFSVSNSLLSEYAVLGFEMGYAGEHPDSLVCWEAQFGDFANTAQVIFDQFLSSQEDKWQRQNGLVVMLPHGYEGQGPEHSSGRLERWLQMCNDHPDVVPATPGSKKALSQEHQINWQVIMPSTPANWFHALRRQQHRSFRKPLIAMTPKSLLRHLRAKSSLEEMAPGTAFLPFIGEVDPSIKKSKVNRVVLCTGKVYYDLVEEREKRGLTDVAICRVEQLSPFPFHEVAAELKKYKKAKVVWCQEEHMNMGAYTYVAPRMKTVAREILKTDLVPGVANADLIYVGRLPSGSTASGHGSRHNEEQTSLLNQAFEI